ncbi:MAG: hypothetical protein GY711_34415 [bacterium]|nr:hypothetical protein [bacterium]
MTARIWMLVAWVGLCSCGDEKRVGPAVPEPFTAAEVERIMRLSPLPELPADPTNAFADNEDAAHFGQFLFFDERLSKAGKTSCASCHDPELSFADGRELAEGVLPLERHSPAIWNVAYNRWFFWDGRADSLWAQALVPLESPLEHAGSRLAFAHLLHGDDDLRASYEALFGPLPDLHHEQRFPPIGRPVPADDHAHGLAREHARKAEEKARQSGRQTHSHGGGAYFVHPHQRAWDSMNPADQRAVTRVFVNLGKSIAAYERKLVSRRSAFDRFVEGIRERDADKQEALSPSARRGLQTFVGKGRCVLCHHGPNFTDMEFHNIRLAPSAAVEDEDPGRMRGQSSLQASPFLGTSEWSDDPESAREKLEYLPTHAHAWGEFKTPSLRNVARTAPYMHQGQLPSLAAVAHFYSTFEGASDDPRALEKTLVPLGLTAGEQADLVAFLESLTDEEVAPALLAQPDSPRRRP